MSSPKRIVDSGLIFSEESHEIGVLIDALLCDEGRSFFLSR